MEKTMNGSGCKNCPVNPCETMNYRGSTCTAQRAKFGLGDPQTNADRIRAMSDEELAEFIRDVSYECQDAYCGYHCPMCAYPWCSSERTVEWLKQPADQPK